MPSRNNPRSRVVRLSQKMARGDACRLSTRVLCCLSTRQAVISTHVRVASACDKRLYRRTYVLPQHATSGYIDARTCCLSMRQAVILTHVRVASACYKRLHQHSYCSRCAVFKFNIRWVHEITRNYNKVMRLTI